jgi:hypothetical protein
MTQQASIDFREDNCIQALYTARWPHGFRCPHCGHGQAYRISTRRLPLFQCRACRSQTSLTAGTIMEGSRTPLALWFCAIHLHSTKDGVNAVQLSEMLGVTYKTAWLICHKIRHAMSRADSSKLLDGLVRITSAVHCGWYTYSPCWHQQEQSLLIASSEDTNGQITRIKMEKQDKELLTHVSTLPCSKAFIDRNVAPAVIRHVRVTGLIGPGRNIKLLQIGREAERLLARRFRGIGPKYLQVYLNQFCYGWNRRKDQIFDILVSDCANTRTITYPELTHRAQSEKSRRSRRRASRSKLAG